jgi:hypothetical protein
VHSVFVRACLILGVYALEFEYFGFVEQFAVKAQRLLVFGVLRSRVCRGWHFGGVCGMIVELMKAAWWVSNYNCENCKARVVCCEWEVEVTKIQSKIARPVRAFECRFKAE